MSNAVVVRFVVLSSVLIPFGACGGSKSDVTAPVPAPTSTPAPAPTPTPVPGLGCNLPLGSATAQCSKGSPTHLDEVDEAIDLLARQRPDIFDSSQERGRRGWYIRSQGQFYLGVMRNLEAKGYCSYFNGDEFQVKNSNALDDAFDLVSGDGFVRRGASTYMGTCHPASFPVAAVAPPPRSTDECHVGPSREIACQRETNVYLPDMEAALDQVVREHPELFDTTDHARGAPSNWYKILDGRAYIRELRRALGGSGFCTYNDGGEELVIKRDNEFSESFDIYLSFDYIRRGEGAYLGTCYPAYF